MSLPLPAPPLFRHTVCVYWEDTDAGGVVFVDCLKFFERARTEWQRGVGIAQHALRERTNAIFDESDTALRYRKPARLGDLLDVTVLLRESGRASVTIAQQAWRGAELLAEGDIRIGCVDVGTFRPRRIPSPLTALTTT